MCYVAVAGIAAVVRQYFMDGYYNSSSSQASAANSFTPSGALLKAMLIASAVRVTNIYYTSTASADTLASSYPSNDQGYGRVQINNKLSWAITASISDNKIKNFTEYADDYDNGGQIVNNYTNTDLAFSPNFVGSGELSFQAFKKTEIALLSKYVSKQYLDNTSNSQRSLDAFFVNDLRLRYNTSFKGVKNIGLTLLINNVFSELYEANGYTFSYMYGGDFTTENYYYPQAPRNFLLSLGLKF